MRKLLLTAVSCLAFNTAQAQMVAPLNILHGSDFSAGASPFIVYGPPHMTYVDGAVTIEGSLSAEDSYMLDYRIKANGWNVRTLVLNSDGGSSYAGFLLASMVRSHHWATVARMCESACVVVWAAGRDRVVQGSLGVHQSADSLQFPPDHSPGAKGPADLKATAHMGAVLTNYGAPRSVVVHMMATPPSAMYWLNSGEIRNWK